MFFHKARGKNHVYIDHLHEILWINLLSQFNSTIRNLERIDGWPLPCIGLGLSWAPKPNRLLLVMVTVFTEKDGLMHQFWFIQHGG